MFESTVCVAVDALPATGSLFAERIPFRIAVERSKALGLTKYQIPLGLPLSTAGQPSRPTYRSVLQAALNMATQRLRIAFSQSLQRHGGAGAERDSAIAHLASAALVYR